LQTKIFVNTVLQEPEIEGLIPLDFSTIVDALNVEPPRSSSISSRKTSTGSVTAI
jgi:hypothetical protein